MCRKERRSTPAFRNTLPLAAKIYGLHQHPGDAKGAISVAAGETREVRFTAGAPGTYLYWATTANHFLEDRDQDESLLDGAFVVDAAVAKVDDRVFVLGIWKKGKMPVGEEIPVVNGKSWPHGEHLTYTTGDTIHWRVINPTASQHAMHLHGFYFTVDAVGDGEKYERYSNEQRRTEVTELIDTGHAFELTWTPDRTGNWLFHCHMVSHMSPSESLHPPTAKAVSYPAEHDHNISMAGLVVGITVLPNANFKPAVLPTGTPRKLQLIISENAAKIPLYKLEVKDPTHPAPLTAAEAVMRPSLLGPPIVLTRGEATEIEIKNQLAQPTSIHWHGIELESYYDGVCGWTGSGQQTTPAVAPGGSFVARMTPLRAGTFIYHTHWHDSVQLLNGVYGPLIVLEPGQQYDATHDRVFVFSAGRYPPFGYLMLMNGHPEPDPIELHAGERYRLRMINITDDVVDLRVRLISDDKPVQWKIVAKDGADLPTAQLKFSQADMPITVGETYDVEYQSDTPGVASLQIWEVTFPTPVTVPLKFSAVAAKQ